MKRLLIILLWLSHFFTGKCQTRPDFNINILDNLFVEYSIKKDSLYVQKLSGFNRERRQILFRKALSPHTSQIFGQFLSKLVWDSLKTEYESESDIVVMDGDTKKITLTYKGYTHTVNLYNAYQKDMDHLFQLVNLLMPKEQLQIKYYVIDH